ncbi:hypothetical protein RHMOL_Rhmol01G0365600 [Rhododendron molle]|uniref:Uncharacterized protein n=1 Tax=Rhododendron molle TaxID=49168 RepID=A0ACC0QAU4_RHOML|nr:hypothetical protein RHMOL_Rhmol01G0365600 [Rhododendron molle]
MNKNHTMDDVVVSMFDEQEHKWEMKAVRTPICFSAKTAKEEVVTGGGDDRWLLSVGREKKPKSARS